MQEPKAVIISLHPEHASRILSGEKKLEFRRVWSSKPVTTVVIYSTAPIQKIVAIATVKQVHSGSPTHLWNLAKSIGGGLTRRALYKYFEGKKQGYAIEFSKIIRLTTPVNAKIAFDNFHPPQSFAYLKNWDVSNLEKLGINKRKNKNIFVVGVHSVGKSTMCSTFAKTNAINHRTASQLIREAKEDAISKNSKNVQNITSNQELLISAVSKILASRENLLLDGHFVLLVEDKPTALPTEIFTALSIDAVVVIIDKPKLIEGRAKNRDGQSLSLSTIDEFQNLEITRAQEVSEELSIPFYTIKAFEQNKFDTTINHILELA